MVQEGGLDGGTGGSFVVHSISVLDPNEVEAYQRPEATAARLLQRPVNVHFFVDGPDAQFDPDNFVYYLSQTLGPNFTISSHGDIRTYILNQTKEERVKAKELLVATHSFDRGIDQWRMPLEEKALWSVGPILPVLRSQKRTKSTLLPPMPIENNEWYDEAIYTEMLRTVVPKEYRDGTENSRGITLVLTGRGIANPERGGLHMRVAHAESGIAVVSTTGLVEAPGVSAESYRDASGDLVFRKSRIEEGDPRITEAMRGSAMQMIMVALGESGKVAQCSHSGVKTDNSMTCRMRDAHKSSEVVATQIHAPGQAEFCEYHTRLFSLLQAGKK